MEINTHKILQKQTENYITFNQIKLREITNIEERIKVLTQMNDEMERKIENLKKTNTSFTSLLNNVPSSRFISQQQPMNPINEHIVNRMKEDITKEKKLINEIEQENEILRKQLNTLKMNEYEEEMKRKKENEQIEKEI